MALVNSNLITITIKIKRSWGSYFIPVPDINITNLSKIPLIRPAVSPTERHMINSGASIPTTGSRKRQRVVSGIVVARNIARMSNSSKNPLILTGLIIRKKGLKKKAPVNRTCNFSVPGV